MNKTPGISRSVLAVFAIISLSVALWAFWPVGNSDPSITIPDSSVGAAHAPNARALWEFERLRDPVTGDIPANMRARELAYARTLPTTDRRHTLAKNGGATLQTQEWSPRGPFNIGGRTRALAVDVRNSDIILAGGVSGGMWRSIDRGQSWARTTAPEDLPSVTCVAQDTRIGKEHIWYYGTGEFRGNSAGGSKVGGVGFPGNGLFKSTDGGATWFHLPSTAAPNPNAADGPLDFVWNIVTNPAATNRDEVFAAGYRTIIRTTDGGATGEVALGNVSGAQRGGNYSDIAITSTGVLYATFSSDGSTRGIFRSEDGVEWTNITPDTWPSTYRRIVIGISPSNEQIVYFLGETPGSGFRGERNGNVEWHSLFRYRYLGGDGSDANGEWEDLSAVLPTGPRPYRSQGSYDMFIAVHPAFEDVVFFGGTNLHRTIDAFQTTDLIDWIGGYENSGSSSRMYPNHHADQHLVVFDPANPDIMYSGHDGGISRTDNCLADSIIWEDLNNGYTVTQFYTIAINQNADDDIILGGTQDNGSLSTGTTDAQSEWYHFDFVGGDGSYCAVVDAPVGVATDSREDQHVYVSSQFGRIFRRSYNDAEDEWVWTRVTPIVDNTDDFAFVTPFVIDPNNPHFMYLAVGGRILINNDITKIPLGSSSRTEENWLEVASTLGSGRVSALGVSKNPGNTLYYGRSTGRVYRADEFDQAHELEPLAFDITGADFPSDGYVSCIAVDADNRDRVITVFSNYNIPSIFFSEDGGSSWSDVGGNLEENPDGSGAGPSVRWASILTRNNRTIYFVGTSAGLYSTQTLDGAQTVWELEGATTMGHAIVDMIAVRDTDGLVAVATHGSGIFSAFADLSTNVRDNAQTSGKDYFLGPTYPNPARDRATITFTLAETMRYSLELFDVNGLTLKRIASGVGAAGTHSYEFETAGLPAGAYFLRLQAGEFAQTRRMIVVK